MDIGTPTLQCVVLNNSFIDNCVFKGYECRPIQCILVLYLLAVECVVWHPADM